MLTPEHKAKRIGRVTSSTAPAILGVDEYASPLDAWLHITGEDDGSPKDETQARMFERGNALEDTILDWGAKRLGLRRVPAKFRVHADHDWLGDSADALYIDDGPDGAKVPYAVAEGKSVAMGAAHRYGDEMTDTMPMHTLVQSHVHLAHWPDAERCYVPILIGGYDFSFRMHKVERSPDFERILIDKLGEWFHRHITAGTPPPPTAKDTELLLKRYAGHVDKDPLPPTPEIRSLGIDKIRAREERKEAVVREKTIENQLRALIGHHEECLGDGWRVTWRRNKPSVRVDHEELANHLLARLPDDEAEALVREFTREKPGNRPLNVWLSKAMREEMGL